MKDSKTRAEASVGLTISELAARTGCTAEAIRYYEREGVVPKPKRSGGGQYRRYESADVERLIFLRRARELGFSISEVRELMTLAEGDQAQSCAEVDAIARTHLAQVEAKLLQLGSLRDELARVIQGCKGGLVVAECRILSALSSRDEQLSD